jgi:putative Mg2+ transporter-C (MgtC) family protein
MDFATMLLRLGVTFILALVFGIERQRFHKPIGFGAFIFVAIGSCALAITAVSVSPDNPLSLLGAIVTGIGFLGAGALIKTTDKIFGFTSAASIWIFAIFGLTIGIGEYIIGFSVYFLIIMVILIDRYLEKKGIGSYRRKMVITTNKIINEKEITSQLVSGNNKYKLVEVKIDKKENELTLIYLIEGKKEDINKIPNQLFSKPWLNSCKVE